MHTDLIYDRKRGIFQYLPSWCIPYILLARWDRPVGIWLVMLPCWWGIALADGGFATYALFTAGAIVMRGAGCIYNDMLDAPFDRQVARTWTRPLAAGSVGMPGALVFLALHLAVGFWIYLQLSPFAMALGALSLVLVLLYPLMKRWTFLPQLFLGVTFNWGVLLAYGHLTGGLSLRVFGFYAIGILWTLCYDTVYAYQDMRDDLKIGVKSLAVKLGDRPKGFLGAVLGAMALLAFSFPGTRPGYDVLMGLSLGGYGVLTGLLNVQDPGACLGYFKRSVWIGLGIWLALFCC